MWSISVKCGLTNTTWHFLLHLHLCLLSHLIPTTSPADHPPLPLSPHAHVSYPKGGIRFRLESRSVRCAAHQGPAQRHSRGNEQSRASMYVSNALYYIRPLPRFALLLILFELSWVELSWVDFNPFTLRTKVINLFSKFGQLCACIRTEVRVSVYLECSYRRLYVILECVWGSVIWCAVCSNRVKRQTYTLTLSHVFCAIRWARVKHALI